MTSYIAITNSEVQPEAPITSELMTKLRDNPLAISEGAAGAPRVEPIAFASGYYTAGAIGTYVFAKSTTASDVAFGSTRAGSALRPTSALTSFNAFNVGSGSFNTGSALSGTWRCMGYYDHVLTTLDNSSNPYDVGGATLWLRIS